MVSMYSSLLKYSLGFLLQSLQSLGAPPPRPHSASNVRYRTAGSARVSAANLQPGETIECAFEDQVRQEHGGLERIADRVAEPALPCSRVLVVVPGAAADA